MTSVASCWICWMRPQGLVRKPRVSENLPRLCLRRSVPTLPPARVAWKARRTFLMPGKSSTESPPTKRWRGRGLQLASWRPSPRGRRNYPGRRARGWQCRSLLRGWRWLREPYYLSWQAHGYTKDRFGRRASKSRRGPRRGRFLRHPLPSIRMMFLFPCRRTIHERYVGNPEGGALGRRGFPFGRGAGRDDGLRLRAPFGVGGGAPLCGNWGGGAARR